MERKDRNVETESGKVREKQRKGIRQKRTEGKK